MSDFQLKNGSEVDFDLDAITAGEYEMFRRGRYNDDGDFEFMNKVTGLSVADLKALKLREWKRLTQAFFVKAVTPLADPN